MPHLPRLARLLDRIRPGFYVIGVGMLIYTGLRLFAPERVELMTTVFFFSNLLGLSMSGMGFIAWFQPEKASALPDTPGNRMNFTNWMLKASRLLPEEENECFIEAIEQAKTIDTEISNGECWSSAISLGGNTGYIARAYFGFASGKLGFAVVFGLPGKWHNGYSLVGDYEQQGSVYTLRNPIGELGAWGKDGTRFIFCRLPEGGAIARLASTRFINPEPCNFPSILFPLMMGDGGAGDAL